MNKEEIIFYSAYGSKKRMGILWTPDDNMDLKGIIFVSHGMSEHILRYSELAFYFVKKGFAVCAPNHEGHGLSSDKYSLGHIDSKNGYLNIVYDFHEFFKAVMLRYSGIPCYAIGHSMGSFIIRLYVSKYPESFDGIILSATGGWCLAAKAGLLISKFMMNIGKNRTACHLFKNICISFFNKKFKSTDAKYGWTSRDKGKIESFYDDEFCDITYTYSGYYNILKLIKEVNSLKWYEDISKSMPVFIIGGTDDSVSKLGKGIKSLYNNLIKYGSIDISIKLYDGGRHEMLNEINRYEVFQDIYLWILQKIKIN